MSKVYFKSFLTVLLAVSLSAQLAAKETLAIIAPVSRTIHNYSYNALTNNTTSVRALKTGRLYNNLKLFPLMNGAYRNFYKNQWNTTKLAIEKVTRPHITFGIIGKVQGNHVIADSINGGTARIRLSKVQKAVQRGLYKYRQNQKTIINRKTKRAHGKVFLRLKGKAEFLYQNMGTKNVFAVQYVISGHKNAQGKSGKLDSLAKYMRSALRKIGIKFKYGFKPHVSIAKIWSPNATIIDKLKNLSKNQTSGLSKIFNQVRGSKSFHVNTILLNKYDPKNDVDDSIGTYNLTLTNKRWAKPYVR